MLKSLFVISALVAAATAFNPFGVVGGIKNCGSPGSGTLGDVSVTECDNVPCFFNPDKVYDVAIKFSASRTSRNLALFVTLADDTAILQVPINGEVQAGVTYELAFPLQVTRDYAGLTFEIRFQILDVSTVYIEICAEATVTIGV